MAIGIGNHDLETAPDERAAASAIQAHLLQILSALGRERLDFYFLRIRRSLEEVQIHGAFEAIESLRADGHIGFLGLMVDGPAMPSLGLMQFHDAFEVVLVKRTPADESSYKVIEPLARERRAGVITYGEGTEAFRSENTVLVKVASPEEIIRLR